MNNRKNDQSSLAPINPNGNNPDIAMLGSNQKSSTSGSGNGGGSDVTSHSSVNPQDDQPYIIAPIYQALA